MTSFVSSLVSQRERFIDILAHVSSPPIIDWETWMQACQVGERAALKLPQSPDAAPWDRKRAMLREGVRVRDEWYQRNAPQSKLAVATERSLGWA